MALTRREMPERRNANHPFFRLPAKLRNKIYARSQHHPAEHEVVTLHFGSERPLLAGFT